MSTYLVHYSVAQQHAAVASEWDADRSAGTHHRARRVRGAGRADANGRVWERARTWAAQLGIVPVPVIAR